MDNKDDINITNKKAEIMEKCLEEIKKDLRHLPCQSGDIESCRQTKTIEQLEKAVQDASTAYVLCHQEKLQPLIKSNLILNEKQDIQQKAIDRIEIKLDKIDDSIVEDLKRIEFKMLEDRVVDKDALKTLEMGLTNEITKIITQRDTIKMTKNEVRDIIKWIVGITISAATLYGIIKAIISAIAAGLL